MLLLDNYPDVVRALAQGRGDAMLGYLERLCHLNHCNTVFVLSTQTMEWFVERVYTPFLRMALNWRYVSTCVAISVLPVCGLPLSACRISGCLRRLLIRSLRQARLTRSEAISGSSRSATSQATI